MMPKSTSYHEKLIQDLKNPLEAAAYIEVVLEEGDPKMLSKALKNVIEAHGGIDRLSAQVKELYNKLDQMLSEKGEIEFYSLNSLLDALGLHLAVKVRYQKELMSTRSNYFPLSILRDRQTFTRLLCNTCRQLYGQRSCSSKFPCGR
ncbi:helix-turn-helix domain-containing transcriptional regulator [Nostoc sp.]|uniref:helix-turn-helix domain-containing transcriptional regulator n=1 Tax=Nostoc sp. TaxID=1180 RepID=UPI003FA610CA